MMRRKDREITATECMLAVLAEAQVCHLALSDGAQPYVLPLSFGYQDGALYVHSAPSGRKLEILAHNPRVSFAVESGVELVRKETACKFSMRYTSVIGFGRARLLDDPQEKQAGLDVIVRHYGAEPVAYGAEALEKLAVLRIEIEEMTCKQA